MEEQMTKNLKHIYVGLWLLGAIPLLSQTGSPKPTPAGGQQAKSKAVHAPQKIDGQQVFQENCSRCHNAPQGFSPSISAAVVRHMRVRAGLSQEDAQALLRFLNP
jgi:cytochrome c5